MMYFNVSHVRDRFDQLLSTAAADLKLVIWDLSSSPYVDISGARLLRDIQQELARRGVAMRLVEARAAVRDMVRAEVGIEVGEVSRRVSIDDAIEAVAVAPPPTAEGLQRA